jgi:hypothetical protein
MQYGSKLWLPAIFLAPLLLAACACNSADELVWDDRAWDAAFLAPDGDSAAVSNEAGIVPGCGATDIARRSQLSAELAGRADPKLLRAARLDAERECSRLASAHDGYGELK